VVLFTCPATSVIYSLSLHDALPISFPWGMLLTGAIGLSLLVLAISGLFFHRYFIKDLFTLRRRAPKLLSRDLHAVAGSWLLPFRSEEHTSELQSRENLVCRLLLEKK